MFQGFCQFIITNTNIITAYVEKCIIAVVFVPHSQFFHDDFWKLTEWNFFVFSSLQSLLVVLNNMTDNFLQTTFKTALNSFLEVRRFHQSYPLSVTTWKVVIPLSAPYREWQVWFAKLKIKIFEYKKSPHKTCCLYELKYWYIQL